MRAFLTTCLATAVLALTACGDTTEQRAASGGLGGAAAGAVVGGPVGAVVGAGVGAAAGTATQEATEGTVATPAPRPTGGSATPLEPAAGGTTEPGPTSRATSNLGTGGAASGDPSEP